MDALESVGGMLYISQLTNNISSSSNTEFHARIIAEKFIKRSLISISNNIIGDAFNDTIDIFDLLNNLLIRNLSEEQMRAKLKSFFLNYNKDKNIKEELLSIIMDTNNDNPNIAFQEKFIKKLFQPT